MKSEDQKSGLAELTAFSGILKLDDLLSQKLKEFRKLIVDLKENAVVRPLIEEGRQGGGRICFSIYSPISMALFPHGRLSGYGSHTVKNWIVGRAACSAAVHSKTRLAKTPCSSILEGNGIAPA